jgi:5-methylcytosine-specific restriction endonuclease McrA
MGKKKKLKGPRVYHKLHGWELSKEYSIEEIEALAGEEFFLDPDTNRRIKLRRANYYNQIGYECANEGCSTTGSKYILGIGKAGDLHLDLYGIDSEGDLHMITIDHIKPKSKGGRNHIENYQTMCKVCNEIKSDTWEDE